MKVIFVLLLGLGLVATSIKVISQEAEIKKLSKSIIQKEEELRFLKNTADRAICNEQENKELIDY